MSLMCIFRPSGMGLLQSASSGVATITVAEPRKIVTDKLRSYRVAHRELIPERSTVPSSMRIIGPSNRMRRPG